MSYHLPLIMVSNVLEDLPLELTTDMRNVRMYLVERSLFSTPYFSVLLRRQKRVPNVALNNAATWK